MKKFLPAFLFSLLLVSESQAQFTRYLVKLKNKGGSPFTIANPIAYLSQRAIDRRTRYGIAIDSTDLPVTPSYVTQIKNVPNVTVLNVSKWLNSISILTTDPNAITTINGFSFVQSIGGIAARPDGNGRPNRDKFELEGSINSLPSTGRPGNIEGDFYNYGALAFNEIHLHNAEFLHNIGLRGGNMRVALLDAGFTNYATLRAFDSINLNNQVLGTWDFVSGNTNVNDHDHGMECLSIIAANIPGQFVGKAPKANFYLYRTEDAPTEYPIEEHNWSCGAEKADSNGTDVISTSLGYTTFDNATFNHTYADMNGNTTMCAIAADLAAKKGMLVFAANGNDGQGAWHYLGTPADGDSVAAIGAVSSAGVVGGFSSYGPSSDGQVKPDIASVGVNTVIQTPGNTVGTGSGTSFACPNMAGMGTCLWQGFPEFNNMKILRAMQQAGSRFTNPDDRVGYGIPNMKLAFANLLIDFATSTSTIDTCTANISWTSKDTRAMKYEIERKLSGQSAYSKVGELFPQGIDSLVNHSYQFSNTIVNSAGGTASYRLRQIIDTAAATFMAVYIDTTNVAVLANCFPNFLIGNATLSSSINNCTVAINWTSRDNGSMKYEIERKLPGEIAYTKVGELPAQAGIALVNHNYQFSNTIINSAGGTASYRIRQIFDTATATFMAVYLGTTNVPVTASCFSNFLIGNAISGITVNNCNATVSWTSMDNGSMKYEIERKVPGEIVYTKVGEQLAQAGVVLVNHSYQFNNAIISPAAGVVLYRIRQIIDTAAATFTAVYIDTVNVSIPGDCSATGGGNVDPNKVSVTVQPNPVSGSSVNVVIETPYAVTDMPISVYDAKGRLYMQLSNSKGTGKKTIPIDITRLARGKYYIKVFNGSKTIGTAELLKL
jgi:serine protease AprX